MKKEQHRAFISAENLAGEKAIFFWPFTLKYKVLFNDEIN